MLRLLKVPVSYKNGVLHGVLVIICLAVIVTHCKKHNFGTRPRHHRDRPKDGHRPPPKNQAKTCMEMDYTLRARRNTCFLRPDTGPCRADILQWYFDARQNKCYRFYWGGCQGNGNRFETHDECNKYCLLDINSPPSLELPYFCSLSFDYGTCFGHYNRWGWDTYAKTCKRRLYSGCGGNQNNFETREECLGTCLTPPNNTLLRSQQFTTCVPFNMPELMRK